jgi:hypothetical protein
MNGALQPRPDQAEPLRQVMREQTLQEMASLLARPSLGSEETARLDTLRERLRGEITVSPVRKI